MINNLIDYFAPEQEIFLDTISYNRIEDADIVPSNEISLLCQDNIKAFLLDEGIKIVVTRSVVFEPNSIFNLTVSFGSMLKFNEKKKDVDWNQIDIADEFRENGFFVTVQLMRRISLMIAQITSSFGQPPLILPDTLASNKQ